MGQSASPRRAAFLDELCAQLGYCGGEHRLMEGDLEHLSTADAVVEAVLVAEGLDPVMVDRHQRARLIDVVDDRLFAPSGRGHRSGLPR